MVREQFFTVQRFRKRLARMASFLSGLAVCIVIAGFLAIWTQSEYGLWPVENGDDSAASQQSYEGHSENSAIPMNYRLSDNAGSNPVLDEASAYSDHPEMPPQPLKPSAAIDYHQLQQDLAASLMRMEPIRNARVFLAMPLRPIEKASASVLVELIDNSTLSRQQIRSVIHWVAAAVPALEADRIIIVDQRGSLLHATEPALFNDALAGQLNYRKNLEDYLNSRIENILAPVVGSETFRSEVSVDLDFSGVGRTLQSSVPAFNRLLSPSAVSSNSVDPVGKFQAVIVDKALGGAQPVETGKFHRSRIRQKNVAASSNDENNAYPPPILRKISTTILLDSNLTMPGDGIQPLKKVSQDDVKRLTDMIKEAISFTAERGDRITMNLVAFNKPSPEAPVPVAPFWERRWFLPTLKQFTAALALLLLFFGIVRPLVRQWLATGIASVDEVQAIAKKPTNAYGDSIGAFDHNFPSGDRQSPETLASDSAALLQHDMPAAGQQRQEYLKKLIDVDPHAVAEVVKFWLKGKDKDVNQSDQAALLMLSIGTHRAAGILRYLSPRDVQNLAAAMIKAKDLSASLVDKTAAELIDALKNRKALVVDKEDYVRTMMVAALGEEKSRNILDRVSPGALMKGLEKFKWMDSQSISETIRCEHPQIVAIILSVLDPEHAAEVLTAMPENLRSELMMRIAGMKGVQPSALRELDQVMAQLIASDDSRNSTPMGGVEFAAHILNHMESHFGDMILAEIEDRNVELARAIQDKMFVFDDIAYLEPKDIQALLREISTGQLLLALTGAGESVHEKIFKNMSRRAVEMLKEDMALAPEAKPMEIEMARKEILDILKKLADAGEIKIRVEQNF